MLPKGLHTFGVDALFVALKPQDRRIILDLKDMTLTGQDGIVFLARCEAAGIALRNCDPYIRDVDNETRNGKLGHAGTIRSQR
jgi:hypothetical protein